MIENKMLRALIFISLLAFSFAISSSSFPQENLNFYNVISLDSNSSCISIRLLYTGNNTFYINETNPIIRNLDVFITFQSDNELRVLIRDSEKSRWEIPEAEPFPHQKTKKNNYEFNEKSSYRVVIEKSPFSFEIIRKATEEKIFSTKSLNFIYSDRYIEFSSPLPSQNIFGIGERAYKLKLKIPGLYNIWNRDLAGVIDDGESGAKNTYGLFPLYLMKEKKGAFHLVYFRNSNGMDIFLNKTVFAGLNGKFHEKETITYKTVGGVIDLKFFIGNHGNKKNYPEEVIKMFHDFIGGYTLQPFWSFGFHQCRYGYKNLSMINRTLSNYYSSGMPLDTIWMDIDYMIDHRIFTIDEERYNLTQFNYLLNELYHKHLVLIIDPGVAVANYTPYIEGIKRNIFINDKDGKPLLSCVWPGQTHFPDFLNENTKEYWAEMFELLYDKVKFSGIWLDMNELSNFVDGAVGPGECGMSYQNEDSSLDNLYQYFLKKLKDSISSNKNGEKKSAEEKCSYDPLDYFYIYNPGNSKLDEKTICLNGVHFGGI